MNRTARAGLSVAVVAGLGGLFLTGVAVGQLSAGPPHHPRPHAQVLRLANADLRAPADCADLLSSYRDRGVRQVGPYGWESPMMYAFDSTMVDSTMAGAAVGSEDSMIASAPAPSAGTRVQEQSSSQTGTNVQEVGVDEPDTVKTNGDLLLRVDGDALDVYDLSGTAPERTATLDLPRIHNAELLMTGTGADARALAIGRGSDTTATTRALTIDLSDPSNPSVTSDRAYDGRLVRAVQHGSDVRLVLDAPLPELPGFVQPRPWRDAEGATKVNRDAVRHSSIDDWLPTVTTYDASGRSEGAESVVDCSQVAIPADDDAPLGTMTVVGLDLTDPGHVVSSGIATSTDLVYVSPTRLYLATSGWGGWGSATGCCLVPPCCAAPPCCVEPPCCTDGVRPPTVPTLPRSVPRSAPVPAPEEGLGEGPGDGLGRTHLYAFALDGLGTRYTASGEVDGLIRDRWAMDESDGVLRIAVGPSQHTGPYNSVLALSERGSHLELTGQVDRLGVGEEIKSVRWFDDLAIVVTFRQMDPLYAIDFSNPARPRLAGELKIPGFSDYLHPIGGDRLVGMGQDATETGQGLGAQAALFDVSDLAHPRRTDTVGYGASTQALAGQDPRQFTWLPDRRTALTVVARWGSSEPGWVSVLRVEGKRLESRTVALGYGADASRVRLVPVPASSSPSSSPTEQKVVLVADDSVSFFQV